MGKTKLIGRLSLQGQVIVTLVLIIVTSLLATSLTFGALVLWQREAGPTHRDLEARVEQFITQQGSAILRPSNQSITERQLGGVAYQVVNTDGRLVYGSIQSPILHNRTQLLMHLNTTEIRGQPTVTPFNILRATITRYYPIVNRDGVLDGAIVVQYPVFGAATHPSQQGWMTVVSDMIPFVPFLFFCLFSYLFAKQFGRRVNQSLQVVVQGARRIEQRDLDFAIEPTGPHEIGQVLVAFENMRVALKASLVRQWQLEEDRRRMIAAVSHDLRTPLTIIRGHVESLLDGAMARPDRLARYLQTVMHNTNRVTRLLEEMQNVTDLEKPDFSLHPTRVDIHQFITAWARDFELLAGQEGVQLDVQFHDDRTEPLPLAIDPERVSQVLDNIASNSLRFTPQGGTITLRADVSDSTLSCEISDTGPGFTSADLQHLFDPFYQGDTARSQAGHSGLGLYTAKKLIEKHGGTISAGNCSDGGAFVRFTIPSSL